MGSYYVNASLYAGREAVRDSRYAVVYGQRQTDIRWDNIVGGDMMLNRAWLSLRLNYLQARTALSNLEEPSADYNEDLQAYGVALNLDLRNWFVLSEWATNNRVTTSGPMTGLRVDAPAWSLGVGYRGSDWTVFVNRARYDERSSDLALYRPEQFERTSVTLRYDLTPRS